MDPDPRWRFAAPLHCFECSLNAFLLVVDFCRSGSGRDSEVRACVTA